MKFLKVFFFSLWLVSLNVESNAQALSDAAMEKIFKAFFEELTSSRENKLSFSQKIFLERLALQTQAFHPDCFMDIGAGMIYDQTGFGFKFGNHCFDVYYSLKPLFKGDDKTVVVHDKEAAMNEHHQLLQRVENARAFLDKFNTYNSKLGYKSGVEIIESDSHIFWELGVSVQHTWNSYVDFTAFFTRLNTVEGLFNSISTYLNKYEQLIFEEIDATIKKCLAERENGFPTALKEQALHLQRSSTIRKSLFLISNYLQEAYEYNKKKDDSTFVYINDDENVRKKLFGRPVLLHLRSSALVARFDLVKKTLADYANFKTALCALNEKESNPAAEKAQKEIQGEIAQDSIKTAFESLKQELEKKQWEAIEERAKKELQEKLRMEEEQKKKDKEAEKVRRELAERLEQEHTARLAAQEEQKKRDEDLKLAAAKVREEFTAQLVEKERVARLKEDEDRRLYAAERAAQNERLAEMQKEIEAEHLVYKKLEEENAKIREEIEKIKALEGVPKQSHGALETAGSAAPSHQQAVESKHSSHKESDEDDFVKVSHLVAPDSALPSGK